MVEVSRHEPGSFSWAELATSDPAAAKRFYSSLFGWSAVDFPDGARARRHLHADAALGKDVAALYKMMKEQAADGVPPHWMCYVTVENADATARHGPAARRQAPRRTLRGRGPRTMAIIQDLGKRRPRGLAASRHAGIGRINEPGALCWCELATRGARPRRARSTRSCFGLGPEEPRRGIPR
jgi:predicted enzyme related to lactoylglutathione lyase